MRTRSTASVVQEKMKKQARSFFAGEEPLERTVDPSTKEEAPSWDKVKFFRKNGSITEFKGFVLERQRIAERLKELEGQKATASGYLTLALQLAGEKSVRVEKFLVTLSEGKKASEKVDPKKLTRQLLKRGFSADDVAVIIGLSTVKGKAGTPYVNVTDTTVSRGKGRK